MEITTDNATPIFTLTGMELEYYIAAMEGKIDVFEGKGGEQIESILTPNKNTILHIYFTNYTDSVSDTFVEKVLNMSPKLLLKTNVKHETILHIAARHGHHKIVRKLIDHAKGLTRDIDGVGVEKRLIRTINDKKDTALHEAVRFGHTEVVEVLIKEEPDHSYFGKNDGDETPLYIAVERQYWNVVDTILDNSKSPQYNGPNGRTALHAATIFGDREKVSKLLTRNLLLAKQADENGWVPLHLAAMVGCSEVVELLVTKERSTTYMRDNKGRTALHFAAICADPRCDGSVSAMEIILKYCPDCCELVDEKGRNALHYTTMGEESNYLHSDFKEKEILEKSPLMRSLCNDKDDDGNTPLHYIARLAPKWEFYYNHVLLEPQFQRVVDKMTCNKYGQNPFDVAGADMTRHSAFENKLCSRLQDNGAMLGGRVPDKHLREKKQENRHDLAVVEKEKGNKNIEDVLSGVAASISLVAILIATVTFTAGFTLPGGLQQEKGSPILKYNAAFIAFAITDSLSFVLSTSAVLIVFFSSLSSRRAGGPWDKNLYFQMLAKSAMITLVAMGFMIIAFGTGLYAVLGFSKGFGIVTLLIVLIFFIFFIHLVRVHIRSVEQMTYQDRRYLRYYPHKRLRDIQLSSIL